VPSSGHFRRAFLLEAFGAALAAVDGRARVRDALAGRSDLARVWVLAVGKAACAMTRGAVDALGPRLERALVVSRAGHFDPDIERDPRMHCIAAGHPLPDRGSLAAGAAALELAAEAGPGQPLLLLVSGGASSLIESPPEGVTLDDLRRVSDWALATGLPIERINALRRRLSRLKDGRLLALLSRCHSEGFFISDVPGDDPALVGSGLLAAAPRPVSEEAQPAWLEALLKRAEPAPARLPAVPVHCVGRLDEAIEAAVRFARAAGARVERLPGRLDGDAVETAAALCSHLAGMPPGLLVAGGETTVRLPAAPGRGGRNQHLALAVATTFAGRGDWLLLSAGTDGSDGNSSDAGAVVDGGTADRGRDAGLDPADCLARADSGRFLEASGDLVHTGATGTNVGDLVLAFRCDAVHSRDGVPSM
jgi:hydroxypyruvate reductase